MTFEYAYLHIVTGGILIGLGVSWFIVGVIFFFADREVTSDGLLAAFFLGTLGAILWVLLSHERTYDDTRYYEREIRDLKRRVDEISKVPKETTAEEVVFKKCPACGQEMSKICKLCPYCGFDFQSTERELQPEVSGEHVHCPSCNKAVSMYPLRYRWCPYCGEKLEKETPKPKS